MGENRPAARVYPVKTDQVYLFATCLIDQFCPQAGLDTVRLLEGLGLTVHFPAGQTCCGQPAHSSGFPIQAAQVARQQLDLFPQDWPVIVPSGSCGAMIRHHYPALFANDPALLAQANQLAERVFELTEYLVHVLHYVPKDLGPACDIALHTSCHARREMGCHETSTALLGALANVTLHHPKRTEECCGFGGTFSVRHTDIAGAMVEDKVASIQKTGASAVISADCGCLLNIVGHADLKNPLPGSHIASFLWQRTHNEAAS